MWRKPTLSHLGRCTYVTMSSLVPPPRCRQCRPLPSYAVDIGRCHRRPDAPLSAVITRVSQMRGRVRRAASRRGARRCVCVSGRWRVGCPTFHRRGVSTFSSLEYRKTKSVTSPALLTPVLRHQAEAQIAICAKPGAHPAHTPENPPYARRKKKLKSLKYLLSRKDNIPLAYLRRLFYGMHC